MEASNSGIFQLPTWRCQGHFSSLGVLSYCGGSHDRWQQQSGDIDNILETGVVGTMNRLSGFYTAATVSSDDGVKSKLDENCMAKSILLKAR